MAIWNECYHSLLGFIMITYLYEKCMIRIANIHHIHQTWWFVTYVWYFRQRYALFLEILIRIIESIKESTWYVPSSSSSTFSKSKPSKKESDTNCIVITVIQQIVYYQPYVVMTVRLENFYSHYNAFLLDYLHHN